MKLARYIFKVFVVAIFFAQCLSAAPAGSAKTLQIYCIDVEGGQATLFVTPQGESLLIDTGWDGFNGRDADRIVAAAKDAGISKIDYVLITHYHSDHVGGATQLAARIPVGTFIDHGENTETNDAPTMAGWSAYQRLLATGNYKRISVKPGETLPIKGAEFVIVNGDGKVLERPLSNARMKNENCKPVPQPAADHTENEFSLGLVMNFGNLRLVDLGDLPWAKELELMCPLNKIGKADILIATHHGFNGSGSPALVHGVVPRVAIMENGAKKGASPSAWDIVHSSPGLSAFYQLHWSEEGGAAHNSPAEFLANIGGQDSGNYFKITARPDGSFDVLNSRTGKTGSYLPPK